MSFYNRPSDLKVREPRRKPGPAIKSIPIRTPAFAGAPATARTRWRLNQLCGLRARRQANLPEAYLINRHNFTSLCDLSS